VSLLVWLAFGAVATAPAMEALTWQLVVYAVLSLTVIRMAPVALALAGAGARQGAVAFVGWFGPRGLASVVFALLALEDLGERVAGPAVAVIAVTVLFSVIAHGATAEPLARRYGPLLALAASRDDPPGLPELPPRRPIRRAPAPAPADRARVTGRRRLIVSAAHIAVSTPLPNELICAPYPIAASNIVMRTESATRGFGLPADQMV
jgi:hypothetical protein